jgi:hypothetical protein
MPKRSLFLRIDQARLPVAALLALLQRTPAVRVAVAASEYFIESPIGAVLKAAAASVAALGAVDSVVGASPYTLITGTPGHPSPYTVALGSQIEAVPFGLSPQTIDPPGSWIVTGSFPPGLSFGDPTTGDVITSDGTYDNSTPVLSGTPTVAGDYIMGLQAVENAATAGMVPGDPGNDMTNVFTYEVIVTGSAAPTPTPTPTPTPPPTSGTARLINISTRAQVGTGGNILIPGFVISGSGTETLLIRADGPALTQFGVGGVLAQPSLSVFNSAGTSIASNTGWGTNANPALIASTAATVGAFALTSGSADCALIASLPAGAYTVQISGVNKTTGVALAEVYEVSASGTRLVNISTRANVGTGSNLLIPGFVISGSGTEQLLVRADGPALTQFGVAGALALPSLSMFNSAGSVIASNTGWETSSNPSLIASTAATVGAFAFASGSADSAQIVNLTAGAYTIQISGVNSSTGVALAEVYEVPVP